MDRVVPSMLYQKIKFVTEGQLVCIFAEEDMIDATSSRAPYVEVDEECSCVMYVGKGSKVHVPKLSKTTHSNLKQVANR